MLVTGIGGFVGRYLAALLLTDGHRVSGLARRLPEGLPDGLSVGLADLADAERVRAVVTAARPDLLCHLAAVSSPTAANRDPLGTLQANVLGTAALLEAARACPRPPRVLMVTTSEIYGQPPTAEPLTEDSPARPASVYGTSKLMCHELCQQYHRAGTLEIVEARPFNHIGPGQQRGFVVPDFAAQVAAVAAGRQAPVIRVGDLTSQRDFSDVRDVVRGYRDLALHGAPGAVYHLCSGRATAVSELLERLMDLAGVHAEVQAAEPRAGQAPICGSFERARQAVGWTPTIPLDTTLAEVLAEWQARMAAG